MKNKHCAVCGRRMQRWGKTAAGTPRYRCLACKTSSVIHRTDTHVRHDKDRLVECLTGVASKATLAKKLGLTRQALSKEFRQFFRQNPNCKIPEKFKAKMLIVDGKFIHGRVMCALIALTEEDRIFWQFALDERYGTWYGFLVHFSPPEVVVADGQKGMAYFVKKWWPKTAFQRCHFHLVQNVIHYLSRNPKEEAGCVILDLVHRLKEMKSHEEKEKWIQLHFIWEKQYEKVFNEKTEAGEFRYRKLRSVRLILRRAIPDIFTYLDHPGCPNTTNDVEGWINRDTGHSRDDWTASGVIPFAEENTRVDCPLSFDASVERKTNTKVSLTQNFPLVEEKQISVIR